MIVAIWAGLPQYLKNDQQRGQERCLDVIGVPRDTPEPLEFRCTNLTKSAYQHIVESESQLCGCFIKNAIEGKYELR